MSNTKNKKVLGIVICVIYLFYSVVPYIEIKSEASTALDTYAPSVSIGQPMPQGFSILDISNFLSHVLDSAAGGVKKNLGYIWNRIVDSGYCPASENHRHSFIYGLTSSSITADLEQPREGYYCYCEKCGQLAGTLINEYIQSNNIQEDGKIILFPSITCPTYKGGLSGSSWQVNNAYVYGVNFSDTYDSIGFVNYEYYQGYNLLTAQRKRGAVGLGYGFDIEGFSTSNARFAVYYYKREVTFNGIMNTYNYEIPRYLNNEAITIGDKYIVFNYGWASDNNIIDKSYYDYKAIASLELTLPEEELNDNYNYDNIQAPIAYVNNGTLIYGGYSSSIVDTETMIYTDPSSGTEYEIDSMEYDYSTNTYTLDISDFLNGVTVEFGVDGIKINENGQDKQYFYVTNPLTPVNPVTNVGTGTGLVNLDGTINLTVNQVSSNTNAYITTNEDIPQGLRALRETLATMFVELPEMTGEVTDFMQEGFSYIPQEVTTLIIFGVSVAVFVGIFKLFWR